MRRGGKSGRLKWLKVVDDLVDSRCDGDVGHRKIRGRLLQLSNSAPATQQKGTMMNDDWLREGPCTPSHRKVARGETWEGQMGQRAQTSLPNTDNDSRISDATPAASPRDA